MLCHSSVRKNLLFDEQDMGVTRSPLAALLQHKRDRRRMCQRRP